MRGPVAAAAAQLLDEEQKELESEEESSDKEAEYERPPAPVMVPYAIKSAFVNSHDRAGHGFEQMCKNIDREKFNFWFFHYEKYGDEGQREVQFGNLHMGIVHGF